MKTAFTLSKVRIAQNCNSSIIIKIPLVRICVALCGVEDFWVCGFSKSENIMQTNLL